MPDSRGHQKHGPQKAGELVDHNLRCVLFPENLFRLLRYINGQKSQGQRRQQVERPGQGGKDQIDRYGDNRSRRSRSKGYEAAAETGGNDLDEFFAQKTPLFGRIGRV